MTMMDGLQSLLDRFSDAQARFDAAEKGSPDRMVATREERALREAIGDVVVALLPTLVGMLIGLDRRVNEGPGFAATHSRMDGRLSSLESRFDDRLAAYEAQIDRRLDAITDHLGMTSDGV